MNAITEITTQNTIEELVVRAQSGDRIALGDLFSQFTATVHGIALRRLKNQDEAQELTQDIFVQAMTKLDQLVTPAAFPGWIKTMATRMAINRAVRGKRLVSTEPEKMAEMVDDGQCPMTAVMDRERRVEVREGLAQLREMDRETLEAFYVKGQSLKEMCDHFDAPMGTIKRRLHTARQRLAQKIEDPSV